uniref:Uncharacterized protein n=1 Tax=Caenorhabditis tropicalis TaxID=1561998 RepID=A0A1I7URF0_9PELO
MELEAYFRTFGPFDRKIAQKALEKGTKFNEKLLETYLKIEPFKWNMRMMWKALKMLSEKSERVEVQNLLEVIERLQGLQDPEAPPGLMEMTKEMWRRQEAPVEKVIEKKEEKGKSDNR